MGLQTAASQWMAPRTVMGAYTRDQGDPDKERPTLEGQAIDWRAPQAGDATRGAKSQRAASYGYRDQAGMHSLVSQTANWAGPKASDAEKAGPNMRGSKGDIPLPAQAMNWAGPAAQNHKGSSQGSITRADGKSRADILSYQAEQFFDPPSSPDHPTFAGGSTSSTDGPNSNQPSVKRKLNPIFVEALMRWPTGLSGFARPETAWILWQQQQLTYVSMLLCALPEPERGLFE